MALNLKKGEEDNSETPSTKKKGLNLSKSDDSNKSGFNLSKDEIETVDSPSSSSDNQEPQKKSPVVYIIIAVIILGIGGYWMNSKNNAGEDETSVQPVDSVVTTNEPLNNQADSTVSSGIATPNPTDDIQVENSAASPNNEEVNVNSEVNAQNQPISDYKTDTDDQKARQVIDGKFGNGVDRKNALGDQYETVQAKVNALYRSGKQ